MLSWGLTSSQFYHLSIISLSGSNENQTVVLGEKILDESKIIPHKIDNKSLGVKISALSAAVMDKDSGIILWNKDADQLRSLASITKLMTALVFLENNSGWDVPVTLEKNDESNGGTAHILRGETVTVQDLFNVFLVASDNNSGHALARSTGLEREDFIRLMNQKAGQLGLSQTKFVDITGLKDGNKSTAADILKLAKTAFNNNQISSATIQKTYSFSTLDNKYHKVYSTNKLLDSYLEINAGKTGYIAASGYCLVAEVKGKDNRDILVVVLGSDSNLARFYDLKVLSAWTLENFTWY
ncbi:serine hydrolase [bacterium]|nr:serine hydrolase [bacterium]